MTNPVTAVELARYDTRQRDLRVAAVPSHRWRMRAGAVLETWGRRLRAGGVGGTAARVTAARVTAVRVTAARVTAVAR